MPHGVYAYFRLAWPWLTGRVVQFPPYPAPQTSPLSMAFEFELRLHNITCEKSNEEKDDVFVTVGGKYADGTQLAATRFPEDTTWDVTSGQSLGPNLVLFAGEVRGGITLEVKFQEQDAGGFLSITDDSLGGFKLELSTERAVTITPNKKTEDKGNQNNLRLFTLSGSNAVYHIEMGLYEKVSLLR